MPAWSYSALTSFELCPKNYWHTRVKKDVREAPNVQGEYGRRLHKAIEERLKFKNSLPPDLVVMEPWAAIIETFPGTLEVEKQIAITKHLLPCEWFAPECYCRVVIDVLKMTETKAVVVDWKTGKMKDDEDQLILNACLLMFIYPQLEQVKGLYVWLSARKCTEVCLLRQNLQMQWERLETRATRLMSALASADHTAFPPTPNNLCKKWCPVRSCPHHGTR